MQENQLYLIRYIQLWNKKKMSERTWGEHGFTTHSKEKKGDSLSAHMMFLVHSMPILYFKMFDILLYV